MQQKPPSKVLSQPKTHFFDRPLAGVAAKRPGVDFNPAILGKGSCRGSPPWLPIMTVRPECCSSVVLVSLCEGLSFASFLTPRHRDTKSRVRMGTRSRAVAAPGTCPRSAPGFSNAAAVRWRPEAALTGAPPRTLFIPGHSFHNTRDMTCSLSGRNSKERL